MKETIKENWFILGDIHGSPEPIHKFYMENRERLDLDHKKNSLLLLGDVGANYSITGNRDYKFKKELAKYPFTYICLRGNHEARVSRVLKRYGTGWDKIHKYGGQIYVEREFPMIEYLDDGPAVYDFFGYRTLSLPGAYSVDKFFRLRNGWKWFDDEQMSPEEMDYARELKKQGSYDLVISHTCPIHMEPTDLFLSGLDQSSVDKTMERFFSELEYGLDYKRWAWGHYHADRLYPWNGGKQMLMLFNENVVDLRKFMEMTERDSLEDILA